ncbi:MAG: dicarboxylate/amino acid:cation symporter [Proteobacteria bacterium]|nr:dicarboxylate/amino acid:cation symporter [Pseudomonadota bacterium]MBK9251809.1 dicarboxylate/amino acid:cation symporter [Pseudomonadota bacterium]
MKLGWILAAMALGVALGLLVGDDGRLAGLPLVSLGGFLGSAFLNLLRMLVVPLVVSSIISGIAAMGNTRDLGRLGVLSLLFYVLTTLIAVVIALVVSNVIAPGIVDGEPAGTALALHADGTTVNSAVQAQAGRSLGDILLGMIPVNIVEAAAGGKLIGLLLFSVMFGVLITQLEAPLRETMTRFWEGTFGVMMRMTGFIMRLAPVGVLGLTLKVTAEAGLDAARPLLMFGFCVVLSLAIYAFAALPALMILVARVNPWRLFPAMAPALLTAFSSASSSATLPITLDCLQRRAGVSPRIAGFVLPLGTSINHAGSALYECAAALFIAQAYGLHLSIVTQATVVLLALVTSMGIAGIPAASLVGITVILTAVGLPAEAIGVLLVLDRLLDMARTAVNVLADAVCTVIVARLSGDQEALSPGKLMPTVENPPST